MSGDPNAVLAAIDRWERAGLLDAETSARLRSEATQTAGMSARRLSQYVLATTAAVVLVIAGGLFLEWTWPHLGPGQRAGVLAALGLGVIVLGAQLEDRRRWLPAAYLMQIAGLFFMIAATIFSTDAWADETLGGFLSGTVGLLVTGFFGPRAMRRNVVMPAVHLACGLVFMGLFLIRGTPLKGDDVMWAMDAVLLVAVLGLFRVLAKNTGGERHPWALNAFVTALLAGFVMIAGTWAGPLDARSEAMYPMDLWLGIMASLSLWGLHRGPDWLQRAGLEHVVTFLMLLWIPFGLITAVETLDGPPEAALILVGLAGVVGFVYAVRVEIRGLMAASALAFIVSLWYWGVERGGTLGAVMALVATAGILFWVSGKAAGMGRDASPPAVSG
ncbi:MAG: hypothetical protein O2992_01580 [Gemmatimonadetes bacterium]|jgi:hypothetical protein|nr:hypothetical protein [Gemmatimonadota bacterium]